MLLHFILSFCLYIFSMFLYYKGKEYNAENECERKVDKFNQARVWSRMMQGSKGILENVWDLTIFSACDAWHAYVSQSQTNHKTDGFIVRAWIPKTADSRWYICARHFIDRMSTILEWR